jgi:hypothetical protein
LRLPAAAAGRSDRTEGVGLVHQEKRSEFVLECDQIFQGRLISIHREDTVHDHQDAADTAGTGGRKLAPQGIDVVMLKLLHPGARQLDRRLQALVGKLVQDAETLGFEQGPDRCAVGGVAGRESDRRLLPDELRQLFFQGEVQIQRAGEHANAARRRAVTIDGILGCRDHSGMRCEPQIAVR